MLRTNLSSRPFYNDRAIRIGIVLAVVFVAALTTFNVLQVLALNSRNSEMTARAQNAEAETAQFRAQARTITEALDREDAGAVQQAAREANLLIERRAFSWTDLFNRFENTLPADVRISTVQPQVDREGRYLIAVTVVSRRVEDLHTFMDQLEASGGMQDVLSRSDVLEQDGTTRSIIQGYYLPAGANEAPAVQGGAAGDAPANDTPSGPDVSPPPANAPPPAPRGGTR